ncbi:MAG: sensor histidine kinase [Pirellulales bacterium]
MNRICLMDNRKMRPADVSRDQQKCNGSLAGSAASAASEVGGREQREQQALSRLLDTYEQYRTLVAFEIHDGVVQCLSGALLNLEASVRILGNQVSATAQEGFERTRQLLHDGIAEARCLMNGLRPEILEDFGIIAALDHLVCESRNRTQANIAWSYRGSFDRLAPPLELTLFRIIQESLANALRHSNSGRVCIALSRETDLIQVIVEDWGCGFDPQKIARNRFGVRGICERAKVFGGKATIDSAPGEGTCIVVDLPFVEVAS